jgi:sarcosine oxidase subunit gamma
MADPLRFPAPLAGGPVRRGALGPLDLKASPAGLRVVEVPFPGVLLVRGAAEDGVFRDAVAGVLAVVPMAEPGGVQVGAGCHLLCLGPDEWLAVLPSGREEIILRSLSAALEGANAAVLDVSDSHAVLELSDRLSRDFLSKGCPLDLHPRALPPGRCARTTVAGVAVVIQSMDGGTLRLFLPASVARWVAAWLLDAAAEY